MEVANFFWHGRQLSLYERECIASFVRNGFSAIVWSYDELVLPPGAKRGEAEEILPKTDIAKFKVGGTASLAAFSDVFRFTLLSRRPGWWFDADVFCLKDAEYFRTLRRSGPITIGKLHNIRSNWLESAVLYIEDGRIKERLLDRIFQACEASKYDLYWGQIGPVLLSDVVTEFSLQDCVLDQSLFYPTHFHDDFFDGFLPEMNTKMAKRFENALCYHLWQNQFKRFGIPTNILPPRGSAIFNLMVEGDPHLADAPSLDPYCIERLNTLKEIGDRWRQASAPKKWVHGIPHFGRAFRRRDDAHETMKSIRPLIPS